MIYAISDIHGNYTETKRVFELLGGFDGFLSGENKLITLGDYIDGGGESLKCLELLWDISEKLGENAVIIRGNHEKDFVDFIDGEDVWLTFYKNIPTLNVLLNDEELARIAEIETGADIYAAFSYIRERLKTDYPELISWMRSLPYFYETDSQIFVHAGIFEEAREKWREKTSQRYFVSKFPPNKGKFYKDIISGHVSTKLPAEDYSYEGVFFDGMSHYFIDGGASYGGKLLCLAYDEKEGRYYEFLTYPKEGYEIGDLKPI